MVKDDRQPFFIHKLTNISFVFLAFIFSLGYANGQGEKGPKIKEISSAAVAVIDKGNIYIDPALTSEITNKFQFNECFIVTGVIMAPKKGWEWIRIKNTSGSKSGWAPAESFMWLPTIGWKPTDKIDWISVRYNIASQQFKKPEITEKIINLLLKKYPKHLIPTEVDEGVSENKSLKEIAPEAIAQVYARAKKYDKAIKIFSQLADSSKKNLQKKAEYYLQLLQILNEDKNTDSKVKERFCWKILKEVPNIELSGDEWNDWPDDDAALLLLNLKRLDNDERGLGINGDKVMKIARNFRVYILGAEAKIESLMAQNQYATAKKLLLKTYKKYPSGISSYFKSSVNSTLLLFGAYLKGFDHDDPSHSRKLAAIQELEGMKFDDPIKNYIIYQRIVTLDDGAGLKEDFNGLAVNNFFDDATILVHHKYFDQSRLERIKLSSNFQTYRAFLNSESSLSFSHDLQDKSIKLDKGTLVTIEYPDPANAMVKVKLDDGKIGWMDETHLEKMNPEPLFPVLPKANYWTMVGGNPGRSYFIPENPIKNPVLLQTIPYFHANEPLVADLDGDQRPEILANDVNGVLNAIRGDGKGTLFKLNGYTTHGVPTLMEGALLVIADSVNDGKWLVDFSNDGTEQWKANVGKDGNVYRPEGACVLNDKVYSDRLSTGDSGFQCFDLKTGKELWAYTFNFSTDFRPLFEKNITVFSAEHHFMDKDNLVALDLDTQKVIWEKKKGDGKSLLVSNGILVSHDPFMTIAYQLIDGKTLWVDTNAKTLSNQPNINMTSDGKSLFMFDAISNQVSLKCIELATGKRIWTIKRDSTYSKWPVGRMALVNGALYFYIGSTLVAVDTKTGSELWELPLPGGEAFGSPNAQASSVVPAAGHIVVSAGNSIFIIGETSK